MAITTSTASVSAVPSEKDFKATFSLLPEVLKVIKMLQVMQGDIKKEQVQIQSAVSACD